MNQVYQRYHVETREAPDVAPHPSRFRVQVKKHKLLGMVLHELLFEYRGHPRVALSRPCVYGVFGRIVGGLAPRHELCVGCAPMFRPMSVRGVTTLPPACSIRFSDSVMLSTMM
jgi:hypothetical protein